MEKDLQIEQLKHQVSYYAIAVTVEKFMSINFHATDICDLILENPTYRAKCCFELFTVLGW